MSGLKKLNDCFIEACKAKDADKVKAAIILGGDVNCEDAEYKYTPLMWSAGPYFNLDILKIILQHQDVNVNKKRGGEEANALHAACWYKRPLAVELLGAVQGLEVNTQGSLGNTAIHTAVKQDNVECLKALIEIPGIDVNIKDNEGNTAVLSAYKHEKKAAFKVLVETVGVNLSIKDKNEKTLADLLIDN